MSETLTGYQENSIDHRLPCLNGRYLLAEAVRASIIPSPTFNHCPVQPE